MASIKVIANLSWRTLILGGIAAVFALAAGWQSSRVHAQEGAAGFQTAMRRAYREPVTLTSKDGVLEVTLTARQGQAVLDTVAKPVSNMLVFSYALIRGTASDGQASGKDLYPAPTLQVFPGETLIVHFENALDGLTIRDLFDPRYIAKGEEVPLYPEQLTSSPLNLHVHGLHVSPKGNSDNVMLHIPAGMSNTYIYRIPENMPQGAYWYHSHLHGLTTSHVYYGLAGLLAIGRTDGNIPLVTQHDIPIRNMALQYNAVFDRAGGSAQLVNPNWPQWVSTKQPPEADELVRGTYRPLLAPVNFAQSKKGTRYATVWFAGPLSIDNFRGRFEFIPSNLQRFGAMPGGGSDVEADPALPDEKRDVQFTVNGLFQPVIKSKAGQTEIWVLANVSDLAYMSVQLTESATGRHPKIAIVGQDGNPSPAVHHPVFENGTRLVIPPATRYAIAVTMPDSGDLVLEMPPMGGGARTLSSPGILYENDGSENPPARLGTLSVPPSAISYFDGFFAFPTQVLARAVPSGERGTSVAFAEGQQLGAHATFDELSKLEPDVKRQLRITGGFLNDLASKSDPKAFVYAFEGTAFPNVPLLQPRLNSVEEWTFINDNNDEHPIHVHVNDFQVTNYFDPTTGLKTGAEMWEVDNANVPAPTLGPGEVDDPVGCAVDTHQVRGLYRPLRDALPSAQPRRQRAHDIGQRHTRGLELRGGGAGIAWPLSRGQRLRRQWRPAHREGDAVPWIRGRPERRYGRHRRRQRPRSHRRRRRQPCADGRCLLGQRCKRQSRLRNADRALCGIRPERARRDQRDRRADRRDDGRQHHRRVWTWYPERGSRVRRESAGRVGHGAASLHDLQSLQGR